MILAASICLGSAMEVGAAFEMKVARARMATTKEWMPKVMMTAKMRSRMRHYQVQGNRKLQQQVSVLELSGLEKVEELAGIRR